MTPYRAPPRSSLEPDPDGVDGRADDRILGWMLVLIGGIRVAIALVDREVFRAESTIALLMVALGIGARACTPWRTR